MGRYNVNKLQCADDTFVMAGNEIELQEMLDTTEIQNKGLSLNNRSKISYGNYNEKMSHRLKYLSKSGKPETFQNFQVFG